MRNPFSYPCFIPMHIPLNAVRQEQCQHDEQPHHRGKIWRMDRGMWRLNSHGISHL